MPQRLELVSFKICPFVQRSVITLREKDVDFDLTYINLADKPDWFKAISPFGKVPLLRVGDTVIFESAVINEYLDEVYPPRLHPEDPLRRAQQRAWIEFASSLLVTQFEMCVATDEAAFDVKRRELDEKLARLEPEIIGPLFDGDMFRLVDSAYAPFFMRLALLDTRHPLDVFKGRANLRAWSSALLARPAVQTSVVAEFPALFFSFFKNKNGYLSRFLPADA